MNINLEQCKDLLNMDNMSDKKSEIRRDFWPHAASEAGVALKQLQLAL
jgi:hypothetical protein